MPEENGRQWALSVVRRNGRVVTACGTSCGMWGGGPPRDETLTAIWQGAERYGIPATAVTGNARGPGDGSTAVLFVALLALAWLFGAHVQ